MKTLKSDAIEATEGALVLREIWRIKDELSAARGQSIDRLFADARKRQKLSKHPIVNLQKRKSSRCKA